MPTINASLDEMNRALRFTLDAVLRLSDEDPEPSDIFGPWLRFIARILRFLSGIIDALEGDDEDSGFVDGLIG